MLLAEEIANEKAEKEIRGQAQQQVTVLLELYSVFIYNGH